MNRYRRFFYCGLAALAILGTVYLASSIAQPVSAQSFPTEEQCLQIFREVLIRSGIPWEYEGKVEYYTGYFNEEEICHVLFSDESATHITVFMILNNPGNEWPEPLGRGKVFSVNGYPAIVSEGLIYPGLPYMYSVRWLDTDRQLLFEAATNLQFIDQKRSIFILPATLLAVFNEFDASSLPGPPPSEDESLVPPEAESEPVNPEETLPLPPDTSDSDAESSSDSFALPPEVIAGSLAAPIAGALAGATASLIASLLTAGGSTAAGAAQSAASAATIIRIGNELYWSERPWDEAGPGYVTKEEYEHTQRMLAQGYRWDQRHGWVEPGQVEQYEGWQQANRAAVAQEEEQFRARLKQNQPPDKPQEALQEETQTADRADKISKQVFEQLWELSTNLTGTSSTVVGSLSDLFDFKDDAQTIEKMREAFRAWAENPNQATAKNYLASIKQAARLELPKWKEIVGLQEAAQVEKVGELNRLLKQSNDLLGNISLGVDLVDGGFKGLKIANEQGYSGTDKVLAVGAEISKKVLNYALTKNPLVNLVNAGVGSMTRITTGEQIDLSWAIDQGAQSWDKITQEYAEYTGGDWIAGANEDFGQALANDPQIRQKDQYLHAVRRIKQQVEQGNLTRQDAANRIRQLRETL